MKPQLCRECPIGRVSGEGKGQFCTFISRDHEAGDVLYRHGDEAAYVWFIKSGAVELTGPSGSERRERKATGSFIGLESLIRPRYDATAEVVADATLCGATHEGFTRWLGPGSERTCAILQDLLRVLPVGQSRD